MPSLSFSTKAILVGAGWIGWTFSLCAVISMDWINGEEVLGTHYSGLFQQYTPCDDTIGVGGLSWLDGTRALMILGVIFGLAGCIMDAIGTATLNDDEDQMKLFKQIAGVLFFTSAFWVMVGAAIFAANGSTLQSSQLQNVSFGPGFALAWTSFSLMFVGGILAFAFPFIV